MMRLAVFERNGLCRTVAHTGSAHRAVVVKPRVAAFRDGQRGVGHDTAETAAHPAFGDEPLRKRKRPQPADVGHVPLRPVARETERLVGDFGIGSGLENIPEPGARIGSDGPVTALAEPSFEETVHLRKKSLPLHARIEPAVADIDRIAFVALHDEIAERGEIGDHAHGLRQPLLRRAEQMSDGLRTLHLFPFGIIGRTDPYERRIVEPLPDIGRHERHRLVHIIAGRFPDIRFERGCKFLNRHVAIPAANGSPIFYRRASRSLRAWPYRP